MLIAFFCTKGAELANICNEAALYAARTAATKVTFAHLDYAVERVYAGNYFRFLILLTRKTT